MPLANIVIEALIAAVLIPTALSLIFATNTTGWDATTKTVFVTLFPVLVVLAAVSPFIYTVTHRSGE